MLNFQSLGKLVMELTLGLMNFLESGSRYLNVTYKVGYLIRSFLNLFLLYFLTENGNN